MIDSSVISDVIDTCSVFGELKSLRIPKKLGGTGTHRGFGFADFLTKEDAKVSRFTANVAPS